MKFFYLVFIPVLACFYVNHASAGVLSETDDSKAGTDGPYVLYRGDQVLVKYVVARDSGYKAITQVYADKKMAQLTCVIPDSRDRFSFLLREKLPLSPASYPASKKMLVLSDIEGNFQAMKLMLRSAGVIDDSFNWSFGDGDLVLNGDFFDRGLNVTECLWLLYKLDGEAEAAGGKLHFILGNHEIMNLQGNTKYARKKYQENTVLLGETYLDLYGPNSELGRWLRTKNAIEKIGDYIFCHGGISLEMAATELSLSDINRLVRQYIGIPTAGITDPLASIVFDTKIGVFWYRGLAKNQVSQEEIQRILAYLGGKRIVLGHTLQSDIAAYYNGQVICIDLYHEENLRQGFVKALWVEGNLCYGLDSYGVRSSIFSVSFPRKPE